MRQRNSLRRAAWRVLRQTWWATRAEWTVWWVTDEDIEEAYERVIRRVYDLDEE